ncbi:MAG: hypothetical protein R3D60_11035 [Paracoccaceae bacterium]
MSEAMTNREIEDVLTSIRRLVAQEGTRPSAADAGKLVLTQAQRITPSGQAAATAETVTDGAPATPPANEAVAEHAGSNDPTVDLSLPAPDFHKLEATIAELEAAVSSTGGAWEPEAAEAAPRPSNVTELYGKLSFAHRQRPEPAPETDTEASDEVEAAETESLVVAPAANDPAPVEAQTVEEDTVDVIDVTEEGDDEIDDDPIEAVIDEATLRAVVAHLVREELHGQLGERITQQVRKLVRAEIAKALDERKFL